MPIETPCVALSSGEPAGIGPDICIGLAAEAPPVRVLTLGDPALLAARARQLQLRLRIVECGGARDVGAPRAGELHVLPVATAQPVQPGQPDPRNADYVLGMLRRGVELCLRSDCAALVTAPVQKSVINAAGVPFSGHTEFLGELTGARQPVMLLACEGLRVALATTHLPLRAVPGALDQALLERIIGVLAADLARLFGIGAPRILVLGLNPHAGEDGFLGAEEQTIIAPVVERLRARGLAVSGPVSADTAFTAESLGRCDAILAMYHDQGLPVIKALGFGEIVNVTLGLPIIRTSVDHGTALALAGSGRARAASLRAAVALAGRLASRAAAR